MNWERRKQSEKWTKAKAVEFAKLESDLTFAEWCCEQGKADARTKFAEWLCERMDINVDEVLAKYEEYEKEQNDGTR